MLPLPLLSVVTYPVALSRPGLRTGEVHIDEIYCLHYIHTRDPGERVGSVIHRQHCQPDTFNRLDTYPMLTLTPSWHEHGLLCASAGGMEPAGIDSQ
jgi:hypothetical protein